MKTLKRILPIIFILFLLFKTSIVHADLVNGASIDTIDLPFQGSKEALVLDKSQNQYFFDPTKSNIKTDGDFTIEAWIKIKQFPAGGSWVVTKDDGSSNRQFGFAAADIRKIALQVRGIGNINSANASLSTNIWTYIAVTWHADVKRADFYINGQYDSTTYSNAFIPSSGNAAELQIGRRADGNANTLDGKIAEVRIWNLARDSLEISNNYNKALIGNEPGLIAYYPRWSSVNLNVPLLKQTDLVWKNNIYDSANIWAPLNPTINNWGCALTSAAMIFQYHGLTKLPDGTTLDPGSLNIWLKSQPDGYLNGGNVNWWSLPRLSKLAKNTNSITAFEALEYERINTSDNSILSNDINNGIADILQEPGHFVVAKGINNETFNINDPFYNRNTLDEGYSNTFLSLNRYIPSSTDLSYIMIVANSGISITLKNSDGNEQGEQFEQQPLDNDENPSQKSGQPIKIFYFKKPETGQYQVELSSLVNQNYNLDLYLYDQDGNVKILSYSGVIGSNANETFEINFNNQDSNNSLSEKIVTFQNLIDDINEAKTLDLINKGSANSLLAIAKNAKKNYESDRTKISLKELDVFQKLLNTFNTVPYEILIKEEAFQILLYDVNYLKFHI
ncbi:MAG: C39 family peptidase [Candidatus Levybacteria bacterium]|nr:C39 family peptidase [Candidatus Levybacteria bacterium]